MATLTMNSNVFLAASIKYGLVPENPEIQEYKQKLHKVLLEQYCFENKGTFVITTDPGEDNDDLVMWRYCFMNTTANLIIVVSNGYHSAKTRLAYIKKIFKCFRNVEFNIPFKTDTNTIIFLEDGCVLDIPLDGYINAGPCNSATLKSIGTCLNKTKDTKVITVGANDDCSLGAGINQKQTDEEGKLINIPNVWNNFIADISISEITYKNLSVNVSRYILIPNPLTMMGTPFEEMAHEDCMSSLIANTGMFLACRPPPQALRVNEGNATVVSQYAICILQNSNADDYNAGLKKIQEYAELSISKGLAPTTYEAASVPIMYTHLLGGKYKEGQFGWAPGDEKAKFEVSCLTEESAIKFKQNVAKLPYFTPAYDVIAFMMALN